MSVFLVNGQIHYAPNAPVNNVQNENNGKHFFLKKVDACVLLNFFFFIFFGFKADHGFGARAPDSPDSPDVEIVNIPREVDTEHVQVRKSVIDGFNMCDPCCIVYCREHRIAYYERMVKHEVLSYGDAIDLYAVEKCAVCSIGLMSIFGWRNCPSCRCQQCSQMPTGMGRCALCIL